MQCSRAAYEIPYPPRDIEGRARPASFARRAVAQLAGESGKCLRLNSKQFRRLLRSLTRKRNAAARANDAARVQRLNAMERYLWRQARATVQAPVPFRAQPIEWRRLLALVPPLDWQPDITRAERRRQALVYQGLYRTAKTATKRRGTRWASPQAKRALQQPQGGRLVYGEAGGRCPPRRLDVPTKQQRYQSVTRQRREREWLFSPWRLDYYERCAAPDRAVAAWMPQARLRQSLMQRGRRR